MILKLGTQLGPYEIVAAIGAGGMGEVYRAHDSRIGREVAIKVSAEQFTDRFSRAIRAVAALNHSNIATLYDVGPDYLVMELVEGLTLADRIKEGAIPLDESIEIARQIADALEAAHEKGIVHRDLKPANIKIKPDGTVKVLDFGLAKVGDAPAASLENSPTLSIAQTAAGMILGTAAYMSPEQAKGKPVDKRSDVWSFGVVLYEMLTGKQLFAGETVSDTLAAVLTKEPDWEKVPAKARPLLQRCLERDLRRRLRDIGDAIAWIGKEPETQEAKRPWLAWSVAAVFMLAFAALVFVQLRAKAPAALQTVRFQIALPDKVSLAPYSLFALSPDGRHLAFSGLGSDNVFRLWVHSLDSPEARCLPGAELNASCPYFAWSPDSRFIAFDAGGKLKKIDISGGPPQTICNLSTMLIGGAWNRDGVIIFGTEGGGLMQVSDKGGIPSPLTKPDESRQEKWHCFPSFLSDDRHFLYYGVSAKEKDGSIYVGSLDAGPEAQTGKRLMTSSYAVAYAPSQDSSRGCLLFLSEGVLFSQDFDEKRLELVGEPVPVIDQVGSYRGQGYFSVSTSGHLAYRTGRGIGVLPDVRRNLQLAWFDRQGRDLGRAGDPGSIVNLKLSGTGVQAAVAKIGLAAEGTSFPDLWLLDFARGTNTRFTFGKGVNLGPAWSPTGDSIIFFSAREGPGGQAQGGLYRKPANGVKEEELLLNTAQRAMPSSWSGDGRFVLYTTTNDPKTKSDLWILPLVGDHKPIPFLRTEFSEGDGQFSPDIRWIAYQSDESGRYEIYVCGFARNSKGIPPEESGKWMVSNGGGTHPKWRGDGKELYYRNDDGNCMAVEITAGAAFQAATPKLLFQTPLGSGPAWDVASDGKRFLLTVPVTEKSQDTFHITLNWPALLKK